MIALDDLPHPASSAWQTNAAGEQYTDRWHSADLPCGCKQQTHRAGWSRELYRGPAVDRTVRVFRTGEKRGAVIHLACGQSIGAIPL